MLQMLTNNHFNGRQGYTPKYIVLHATAGGANAEDIARYFQSTEGSDEPVSSNIVIGTDGESVECVPCNVAAYGNGVLEAGHDPWWIETINPNLITISIEHCKASLDNSDPLTDAQKATSFVLIKNLCEQWNIPKRKADANGGITGHYSISPQTRTHCPGLYPEAELFTYLNQGGETTMVVPTGWHDDGTTLIAPNTIPVVHGFRLHVLSNTWDSANWPLEPELGVSPLELGNPALGAGTRQTFRWKTLEWTTQRGVFEAWTGNELMALRKLVATKG